MTVERGREISARHQETEMEKAARLIARAAEKAAAKEEAERLANWWAVFVPLRRMGRSLSPRTKAYLKANSNIENPPPFTIPNILWPAERPRWSGYIPRAGPLVEKTWIPTTLDYWGRPSLFLRPSYRGPHHDPEVNMLSITEYRARWEYE